MSDPKTRNKVTSKLTEEEKQARYKNARTSDWYDDIWKNVGKCVFCDLKDKYIIYEENGIVLTINLFPYSNGHMLAIPREHITSPKQLSEKQWNTIRKFSYLSKKLIKNVHKEKNMWMLLREGGPQAQMTVTDHLHVHFIPFTKQDLAQWNYDYIKFTPLEMAEQYKNKKEIFEEVNSKFNKKYKDNYKMELVCDLVIFSKSKKILLCKRSEKYKIIDREYVLPGGHIDNPSKGIFNGLKKEILEEISFEINQDKIKLVESGLGHLNFINHAKYLKIDLREEKTFLWNTYLYNELIEEKNFNCSDDCEEVLWLDLKKLKNFEGVSLELKKRVVKAYMSMIGSQKS